MFVAPEPWAKSSFLSQDRADAIYLHKTYRYFPDASIFCLNVGNCSNPPSSQRIVSYSRIGSDSVDAEVYRINFSGIDSALKLMPLLDFNSESKNLNEINIATKCSKLVHDSISPYFPLVYASGFCDNVTFFGQGKFNQNAKDFSTILHLQKMYPDLAVRISRLFKCNTSVNDIIAKYNLPINPANINGFDISHVGNAHYLCSELANEDLLHWTQRPQSIPEWKRILKQGIEAIHDLSIHLNMCHNDLHLGNFLVLDGNLLMHDFGHSEPLTTQNQLNDLIKFFSSVEKIDNLPKPIERTVSTLLDRVENEEKLIYGDILTLFD